MQVPGSAQGVVKPGAPLPHRRCTHGAGKEEQAIQRPRDNMHLGRMPCRWAEPGQKSDDPPSLLEGNVLDSTL